MLVQLLYVVKSSRKLAFITKADTAAILTLDQALDRMEGVKDSMDKTSFYHRAGGAG